MFVLISLIIWEACVTLTSFLSLEPKFLFSRMLELIGRTSWGKPATAL
jgi:hypothetical protein